MRGIYWNECSTALSTSSKSLQLTRNLGMSAQAGAQNIYKRLHEQPSMSPRTVLKATVKAMNNTIMEMGQYLFNYFLKYYQGLQWLLVTCHLKRGWKHLLLHHLKWSQVMLIAEYLGHIYHKYHWEQTVTTTGFSKVNDAIQTGQYQELHADELETMCTTIFTKDRNFPFKYFPVLCFIYRSYL